VNDALDNERLLCVDVTFDISYRQETVSRIDSIVPVFSIMKNQIKEAYSKFFNDEALAYFKGMSKNE
jgi:hypothetical protein